MKTAKNSLVQSIENEISRITNAMDQCWVDNFDIKDAISLSDHHAEIIENFKDNYSSKSIGIRNDDDLTAEEIIEKYGTDAVLRAIIDNSDTEESDYYIKNNEIMSLQIGEYEHQIDVSYESELSDLVSQATDAELKQACADRDSFFTYGYPCDRMILKLDPAAFLDALTALKVKKPASRASKKSSAKLSLVHSVPMTGVELLRRRVIHAAKHEKAMADNRKKHNSKI